MIRIKKQKGGTLHETRCGKRDDSKHDENLKELFNKIRKKWIENKKKVYHGHLIMMDYF